MISRPALVEPARVLRVRGRHAELACQGVAGCSLCARGLGCGGGLLARLGGSRERILLAHFDGAPPVPGDDVLVGLSERALLRASLIVYALPLSSMLAGALSARLLTGSPSDLAALAGAGIGLGVGLALARLRARRLATCSGLQPVIAGRG